MRKPVQCPFYYFRVLNLSSTLERKWSWKGPVNDCKVHVERFPYHTKEYVKHLTISCVVGRFLLFLYLLGSLKVDTAE